jgi:hypothetical protein
MPAMKACNYGLNFADAARPSYGVIICAARERENGSASFACACRRSLHSSLGADGITSGLVRNKVNSSRACRARQRLVR